VVTNLELGGKDPAYVCDDFSKEEIKKVAKNLADGAFYNCGQSCCAIERIYIHEGVYDDFLDAFLDAVGKFIIGDPMDEKTQLGPLARPQQLDVLEDQMTDALQKGAECKCGGNRRKKSKGFFFEPTVFVNVHHDMKIMWEESFGPMIGLQRVKNDEEAVFLMNDTEYGLTAAVFSQEKTRAKKILKRINAGTVYWNTCDRVSCFLPWSGRQHSGLGATLSHLGIRAFLQPKAWHLKY